MASQFVSMARAHTAAAAALVAGVVLVPLGMWLYAKAASVDKGAQVAHANRLLTAVAPPLPGARRLVLNVYERRKWEGESLVPIAGYNVETAYRLEYPVRPATIVQHYKRELAGWRVAENSATLSPSPAGTTRSRSTSSSTATAKGCARTASWSRSSRALRPAGSRPLRGTRPRREPLPATRRGSTSRAAGPTSRRRSAARRRRRRLPSRSRGRRRARPRS